jgi:hypothetical protein
MMGNQAMNTEMSQLEKKKMPKGRNLSKLFIHRKKRILLNNSKLKQMKKKFS